MIAPPLKRNTVIYGPQDEVTCDPSGWLMEANWWPIKPRPDANGNTFTPLTPGLHQDILKLYGKRVPALVIHATDVAVLNTLAFARRTAEISPRRSSYHFLIGFDGMLCQLASIFDRAWHAGRAQPSPKYEKESANNWIDGRLKWTTESPTLYQAKKGWLWPVVDGRVVINPNNWSVGIEVMGDVVQRVYQPTKEQGTTLTALLRLFLTDKAISAVSPDRIWKHGDLDPLNRSDPGFDVHPYIMAASSENRWEAREHDGWDGCGGDEDVPPSNPASGIAEPQ